MAIDASVEPTLEDLEYAHATLERNEPRALFYKVSAEIVDMALRGQTLLTVSEGMAVLLQAWNPGFYHLRPFDTRFYAGIERLVATYRDLILSFRQRSIESLSEEDEAPLKELFGAFEQLLGLDAAARCLNLLAPLFFPLWDRHIARAYGLPLEPAVTNSERYVRFMKIVREQVLRLGGQRGVGRNPLRAIDEYNYCKCSKRWL
jgi:hypothetical protein